MNAVRPPTPEALADELIAVRCQLGERAAFDELIARWHKPLWRYARNLTGNDASADDAAQEVWLRVLRGIVRLQDGARLRAWLFGIARRVLMDRLRERYARPEVAEIDIEQHAAPDDGAGLKEELRAMRGGMARLPLVENEVLTLFYLQELSLDDVAQVLGIPLGTVKSRLFRARKLLRQELQSQGVE